MAWADDVWRAAEEQERIFRAAYSTDAGDRQYYHHATRGWRSGGFAPPDPELIERQLPVVSHDMKIFLVAAKESGSIPFIDVESREPQTGVAIDLR